MPRNLFIGSVAAALLAAPSGHVPYGAKTPKAKNRSNRKNRKKMKAQVRRKMAKASRKRNRR